MSERQRAGIAERLAIYLDPGSDVPVHRQIVDRLWLEVVTGTLETGERLPTVRQLAIDLSVHPNTVRRAYEELALLGVAVIRAGQGTVISLTSPNKSALDRRARLDRLCQDVASQAEALGVSLDEILDALVELRTARRDTTATKGDAP